MEEELVEEVDTYERDEVVEGAYPVVVLCLVVVGVGVAYPVRELGVVPEGDMSVLAVSVSSSSSKRTVPPVRERRVLERALGFMVDSTSQRRTRRSRTRRRHLRSRPVSR